MSDMDAATSLSAANRFTEKFPFTSLSLVVTNLCLYELTTMMFLLIVLI